MIDLKSLDDKQLVEWSRTFTSKLTEYGSMLGLSETVIEKTKKDTTAVTELVGITDRAKAENADPSVVRELTQYKDLVVKGPSDQLVKSFPQVFAGPAGAIAAGVLPRLTGLLDKIKGLPGMTPEAARTLGLDTTVIEKLKAGGPEALDSMRGFTDKVKEHASTLGLSHEEVQEVEHDSKAVHEVEEVVDRERAKSPEAPQLQDLMQYKNMLFNGPSDTLKKAFPAILPAIMAVAPGIIPRFTDLIKKVSANPNFSDTIGSALGITGEKVEPEARERVPAGVGARPEAGQRGVPPHEPEMRAPTWLLPLLLIGLAGLLTWAFWPRHTRVAEAPSRIEKRLPSRPSIPSGVGAGPLTISDVRVTRDGNSTIVTWRTNRPSTGQIAYGKTQSYEMGTAPRVVGTKERDLIRTHALRFTGLGKGTHYFRVMSRDASGNRIVSEERTFVVP